MQAGSGRLIDQLFNQSTKVIRGGQGLAGRRARQAVRVGYKLAGRLQTGNFVREASGLFDQLFWVEKQAGRMAC
ncbi:hypothetical protein BY996DRAFT_6558640 [Phakopsora pachyrhizi]|nr:hypothetical protein BY996DRAFT_6558640 [Phakopsora pachyrhizi]